MIRDEQGSMSAFLAMLFLVFLLLISVCVEGIYMYTARGKAMGIYMSGLSHTKGNYQKELADMYHIYAMDPRYHKKIETDFSDRMKESLDQNGDPFRFQTGSTKISDILDLSAQKGEVLKYQIRQQMQYEAAGDILKNLTKKIKAGEDQKNELSGIKDQIQKEEEEAEDELPLLETPEGERLNILLAFVPEERKNLQITRFDAYLINDSNYFLDFTYSCKTDAGWLVRYHGSIEPNIKLHLETFGKEILNDLERICIQAIAYKKEKAFKQKNPISVEHRVDTVKFYKLHSFRENDYFDEDALIFPIVRNDIPERSFIIDPVEIETAIKQKKDSEKPERQAIKKKHRPINEPLEIDLHINELLDTTAGMSNSDILQYQLQKVREILNEHKNKKGRKIIFIHGKGDGVLRNALITELKTKYKTFYYQDASFREYGYGATQVTIR